jgi:hypothetical protein
VPKNFAWIVKEEIIFPVLLNQKLPLTRRTLVTVKARMSKVDIKLLLIS